MILTLKAYPLQAVEKRKQYKSHLAKYSKQTAYSNGTFAEMNNPAGQGGHPAPSIRECSAANRPAALG